MTTHHDSVDRTESGAPRSGTQQATPPSRRTRGVPRVPRRYGQWAATVLFLLVTVLIAGWLWQQKSDLEEVWAVDVAVPAGSVIERDDLVTLQVAGIDEAIAVSELDSIVGSTAAVGLVPGQVLNHDMLTPDPIPGPGERVVGVELDATRVPGGLAPGDVVTILAVPPTGDPSTPDELESPRTLAEEATVLSAFKIEGAGTRLTLVVSKEQANRVAAFGAAGRVALVQSATGGER